jgi:hypothetical protein
VARLVEQGKVARLDERKRLRDGRGEQQGCSILARARLRCVPFPPSVLDVCRHSSPVRASRPRAR